MRDIKITEHAANHLRHARRILVIGCSGGGTSTLSRKIATALDLPYHPMDREVFWLAGWVQRPRAEQREIISQIVEAEAWLMDGTNPSSFDLRLPRTDLVIWVRLPRWRCLIGVYRRAAKFVGKHRPEMADGCVEKRPNREFLSYIWNFERRFAPMIIHEIEKHGPTVPVITLKSHGEMAQLLDLAGLPH
ncbi:AAA family ATPase [Rhizobium sp. Root274]|uniref:AAA family ATPase n=1 Tax=unclassified Rhizobium TaxID=2613769 RepID=UPI000713DE87|nr:MULTISPECIES: AAA family ATPase [unclassified Rhizobium]KQW27627.1 AAA family ATPase [Rhizobium sp. Root1240]KRD27863.1 AAA family ATPase [Rhizobium sp. Root274]